MFPAASVLLVELVDLTDREQGWVRVRVRTRDEAVV